MQDLRIHRPEWGSSCKCFDCLSADVRRLQSSEAYELLHRDDRLAIERNLQVAESFLAFKSMSAGVYGYNETAIKLAEQILDAGREIKRRKVA